MSKTNCISMSNNFSKLAGVSYNVENESTFITSKSLSDNLSYHKHFFCCLQDKTWIKMPKFSFLKIQTHFIASIKTLIVRFSGLWPNPIWEFRKLLIKISTIVKYPLLHTILVYHVPLQLLQEASSHESRRDVGNVEWVIWYQRRGLVLKK